MSPCVICGKKGGGELKLPHGYCGPTRAILYQTTYENESAACHSCYTLVNKEMAATNEGKFQYHSKDIIKSHFSLSLFRFQQID